MAVARDDARGVALRESELGEEGAPCLVAHLVGAKGDAGDEDVLDEPREADPGPRGGGEEDGVGAVPECVDAARKMCAAGLDDGFAHARGELLDEVVARAKDEDASARSRFGDCARDVVEVRGMCLGRLASGLEWPRRRAVGKPELHLAVAARFEVRPRSEAHCRVPSRARSDAKGPQELVRVWPGLRHAKGRAHEEGGGGHLDEAPEDPHGLAVDHGQARGGTGRDGGDGVSAARACVEVREPGEEILRLFGHILIARGGARERVADPRHEREDVFAARRVREEPVASTSGLVREESFECVERPSGIGAERVVDVAREGEIDTLVGDAPCRLRERVRLVEDEGLARARRAEHAPAKAAVGEHQGVVGDHHVGRGRGQATRGKRARGRGGASRGQAKRIGREPRGDEDAVVLGLDEGGETKERLEGGRIPGAPVARATVERALDAVVVDELAPSGPDRDRHARIAQGLQGAAHPRCVVALDLAGEMVGPGREQSAVCGHALSLLECGERHHRGEQRDRLAGSGRGLGEGDEGRLARRGVEPFGDDAREAALLLAKRGKRSVASEHALDEPCHRAYRCHRSGLATGAEGLQLEIGRGHEEVVELGHVDSPLIGQAQELSIDRVDVHGECPCPAQPAELADGPGLGAHVCEKRAKAP